VLFGQCDGVGHDGVSSGTVWVALVDGARLPPSQASLGSALRGVAETGTPLRTLAGVCLPPSRASPGMAPRGVVAIGTPSA
jgi:hypothetical protein